MLAPERAAQETGGSCATSALITLATNVFSLKGTRAMRTGRPAPLGPAPAHDAHARACEADALACEAGARSRWRTRAPVKSRAFFAQERCNE
jgi:hypothetical protein